MDQIERLRSLAHQAVQDYQLALRSGGEPVYPEWADDILAVCNQAEAQFHHGQLTNLPVPQPRIH